MNTKGLLALSIVCITLLIIWFTGLRNIGRYQIGGTAGSVFRVRTDTGQLDRLIYPNEYVSTENKYYRWEKISVDSK